MLTTSERPHKFRDMIGQASVRTNLINQSKRGEFFSTYIFYGMHGCGKTTSARILAMAMNCKNKTEGEPCGCCPSCKAIIEGRSLDVVEIDGASNNGVDKVRELIEKMQFQPVNSKNKIFIIDEVHMLSNGAFNALLKTLEEPPVYAKFILATTELEKIPRTVQSRSACYPFLAITDGELEKLLLSIATKYKKDVSEEALKAIAKHSSGSVRDAIRDMETCLSVTDNVTLAVTSKVLGIDSAEQSMQLVNSLSSNNVNAIISTVDRWFAEGKQIGYVLSQVIEVVTDIILYHTAGRCLYYPVFAICGYADGCPLERAYYLLDELIRIKDTSRKDSSMAVITAELIRIANHIDVDLASLLKRIEALEKKQTEAPTSSLLSLF